MEVEVRKDIPELALGYMIKDRLGQSIFGTNTYHYEKLIKDPKSGEKYEFLFSFSMNLGVGSYSIAVAAHAEGTHLTANYEWRDQALVFNVVNSSKHDFVGSSWIEQSIEVNDVT